MGAYQKHRSFFISSTTDPVRIMFSYSTIIAWLDWRGYCMSDIRVVVAYDSRWRDGDAIMIKYIKAFAP